MHLFNKHYILKPKISVIFLILIISLLFLLKYVFNIKSLYYPLLVTISLLFSYIITIICKVQTFKRYFIAINKEKTSTILLIIIASFYLVLFSTLSIMKHEAFSTGMYDLGNMDQAIWNASKGYGLENTTQLFPYDNKTRLANHVEPIYFFIALIYKFIPNIYILLILQTIFITLGIIIIFIISLDILHNKFKAFIISLVFAFFPTVQHMNLFDFHADVLAIPFLLGVYFAYNKRRFIALWIFLFFALLCKEYAGLAILGLGLLIMIKNKDFKNGIIIGLVGALYFFFAVYFIMPFFNNNNQSDIVKMLWSQQGGENGIYNIIFYFIRNPNKLAETIFTLKNFEGLFYLFFPLGFIPFVSPVILLTILPVISKDILVGLDVGIHRLACALPLIFICFIYSIKKIEEYCNKKNHNDFKMFVWIFIIVSVFFSSWAYGPSPIGHRFWREKYKYIQTAQTKLYRKFLSKIPEKEVISVSDCFAPHLTHRRYIYIFPQPFYPYSEEKAKKVKIVLVDLKNIHIYQCNCDGLKLLKENNFKIEEKFDNIYLLYKKE